MALARDTLTTRRFGSLRVLVTSTIFDALNRNYLIRDYLTAGFRNLEDGPQVRACPLEIAGLVIAEFSPDLVLAVGSIAADDADLRSLAWQARRAKARLAYWLHDDPYEFDYSFKAVGYADHVFTNDRWALAHYGGVSASHLPMAASREAHHRPLRPMAGRDLDLFFCGVGFANRIDLLARAQASLAARTVEVRGAEWPASLAFARNERLSAAEMADRAARARFTLNVGRSLDIANQRYRLPASTPGPRTFETALSGSAQLYFAAGAEIGDHFEPDAEILLFDNAGEIEEALARADREPDAVLAVAERAQARALAAHTYDHRALAILDTLFA